MINIKFYKDYLKDKDTSSEILVSKCNNSYLIGPLLDDNFDSYSFEKRLLSNSIYDKKIYKKCFKFKINKIVEKYIKELSSNEVIEVTKKNEIIKHKILPVPGDIYE